MSAMKVEELHHRLGEDVVCMFSFALLGTLLHVTPCIVIFGAAFLWKAADAMVVFWMLWKLREWERRSGTR